jgi:hypothetical protein
MFLGDVSGPLSFTPAGATPYTPMEITTVVPTGKRQNKTLPMFQASWIAMASSYG